MGACLSKHNHYTSGEGVWDVHCREYKPVAPKRVESMDINPTVKQIGNHAFCGCRKIKSITIPENVEVVGAFVF
eukprot:6087620-Ditylum_brightwellii.AAC.1